RGIFCVGSWTPLGLRLRPLFLGVSPNVCTSQKYAPPKEWVTVKRRQKDEAEKHLQWDAIDTIGSLGAVCIKATPTFPETRRTFPLDGVNDHLAYFATLFNAASISYFDCLTINERTPATT